MSAKIENISGKLKDSNANQLECKGNIQNITIKLKRQIGLFEGVAIIIGSIIGSGIFISPKGVVTLVESVGLSLVIWCVCGLVSMCGAMVFAGTMMPGSGGDYHYLNETFGPIPAFLYIWVQNLISGPANYAILSLTFSKYITQPFYSSGPDSSQCTSNNGEIPKEISEKLIAACAITLLTFINCHNVKRTFKIQNVIMITKLLALCLVILAGAYSIIFQGKTENFQKPFENSVYDPAIIVLAFYSSVWAYSGWSALNFMTEELKDPNRNLPLAIKISISIVTLVYVLANVAYFSLLSPQEMIHSDAIAVTFEEKFTGTMAIVMPLFVGISVFGSLSVSMLGSSRLLFAGSRIGHFPKVLAYITPPEMTPTPALVFLSTLALIYLIGSSNIYTLITYSSFIYSISNLSIASAFIYLRIKLPDHPRPIKVSLIYPIVFFIVALLVCVLPIYRAPIEVGTGIFIALTGAPIYYLFIKRHPPKMIIKSMEILTKNIQKLFLSSPEDTTSPVGKLESAAKL